MAFWKGLIDDGQKDINPAHVVTLALAAAIIVWGSWEVYHTGHMPSRDSLEGVGFLLGGSGAMNIAHKAEDIVAKFKSGSDPVPAPPKVL